SGPPSFRRRRLTPKTTLSPPHWQSPAQPRSSIVTFLSNWWNSLGRTCNSKPPWPLPKPKWMQPEKRLAKSYERRLPSHSARRVQQRQRRQRRHPSLGNQRNRRCLRNRRNRKRQPQKKRREVKHHENQPGRTRIR